MITGIRRGDQFIPKRYKNSQYQNMIELITKVNDDNSLEIKHEREEVD